MFVSMKARLIIVALAGTAASLAAADDLRGPRPPLTRSGLVET